jgi:hypothetical protein
MSTIRRTLCALVGAVAMISGVGVALAQHAPANMTAVEHPTDQAHEGLYLRLFIGPGYTRMGASEGPSDIVVSGSGAAFGVAVGGSVSQNLIVYGELVTNVAVGPTVEVNGMSAGSNDDVSAGAVGVGVGLAYYVMPANVYVSGTVSMSQISIQEDGDEIGETDFGPGVSLMVGKEWWVSPTWGLGVAAQLFAGQMDDQDNGPTWTTTGFAVAFSATYD